MGAKQVDKAGIDSAADLLPAMLGLAFLLLRNPPYRDLPICLCDVHYRLADAHLLTSLQGLTLLCVGPFLDRWISSAWVFDFQFSVPSAMYLVLSCSVSVLVNISQFMCLGRFSAVSFQVPSTTLVSAWYLWSAPGTSFDSKDVSYDKGVRYIS
jgi:hypothetical protein